MLPEARVEIDICAFLLACLLVLLARLFREQILTKQANVSMLFYEPMCYYPKAR